MCWPEPPSDLITQIFPWVEKEQDTLRARQESRRRNGQDVALSKFLELLLYLRHVILQDVAVLLNKYPDCPLFKHAPLNSPSFQSFASSAPAITDRAEQEARHCLSSIPENIAISLRGIVTTNNMQQEQSRLGIREHGHEVVRRLDDMEKLIRSQFDKPRKSGKRRRREIGTVYTQAASTRQPTPLPTPSDHIPSQPSSSTPIHSEDSHFIELSKSQPSSNTADVNVTSSACDRPDNFSLSNDQPLVRQRQLEVLAQMEVKFGPERLRHHLFEWKMYGSRKMSDEWLPIYYYPSLSDLSVEDVWTEHVFGLNGCLSVTQLNANWAARWRRNDTVAKTEAARRKKLITLIERLAQKPNWNSELALRFLKVEYVIPTASIPHLRSTRAFVDHLQKDKGRFFSEVIEHANNYTS